MRAVKKQPRKFRFKKENAKLLSLHFVIPL